MSEDETIALRVTVIGGKRWPDDFTVIWRGLSIGRIMKASGVPAHLAQWSWSCSVHGKPGASANGNGVDLEDCKAKFKVAWAAIRAGLSEVDIASARQYAERGGARQIRSKAARLKKLRPRISLKPDLTVARGTSARTAISYNIVGAGPAVAKNRRSLSSN